MGIKGVKVGIIAVMLCAMTGTLWAAEWAISPRVSMQYQNNDNLRMTTLPHDDVSTTILNPVVDLGWYTERSEVELTGDWKHKSYSGNGGLEDETSETYKLAGNHKTEMNKFSLTGSLTKDSTLSQEGYNEALGLVFDQIDRTTWNVIPSWTWRVNETSTLSLNYMYQEGDYADSSNRLLFDYDYNKIGGSYFYQFTEQNNLYIKLSSSIYESEEKTPLAATSFTSSTQVETLKAKNETLSYELGFVHRFSSTFKINLGFGESDTDSTNTYQRCGFIFFSCLTTSTYMSTTSSSSLVYTASAEKKYELMTLNLDASQQVKASGLGSESVVESIGLKISRELTSLMKLSLDLDFTDSKPLNEALSRYDRKTYRGELSLSWHGGRQWWLGGRYRYMQLKNDTGAAEPESNMIGINFKYHWDKFATSR